MLIQSSFQVSYYTKGSLAHSFFLTHWGRVTHICVSKLAIIGSDNGLSPGRRQDIFWANDGKLLIRTLRTNFSEIVNEIHEFSFRKIHLKMSGKWQPLLVSAQGSKRLGNWQIMDKGDNARFCFLFQPNRASSIEGSLSELGDDEAIYSTFPRSEIADRDSDTETAPVTPPVRPLPDTPVEEPTSPTSPLTSPQFPSFPTSELSPPASPDVAYYDDQPGGYFDCVQYIA